MSIGFLSAGELYALSCAVIWAVAVILFRKSGASIAPVALNFFKNVIGLALFVVTLPLLGVPFFPPSASLSDWISLIVSGVLGIALADSLFFASLNRLGAGNAAIVDCLYSPFVVLCAFLYLREPISSVVLLAMLLMTAAILVGTWQPRSPRSPAERKRLVEGIALGAVGILLMAVGVVLAKPVLEHADGWWVTTMRLAAGVAFLAVQAATPRHRASVIDAFRPNRMWWISVPGGVIGCYFAMITWILGMKYTLASTASVLNQSSTLFVVLLAAVFLGERLTFRKGAAVGLAVVGAVIVSW